MVVNPPVEPRIQELSRRFEMSMMAMTMHIADTRRVVFRRVFIGCWLVVSVMVGLAVSTVHARQAREGVEFTTNITYAHAGDVALQLDMARPAEAADNPDKPYPTLIFIHGGGWKEGHRSAYRGQIQQAARRGYIAVTITHRLTAETDKNGRVRYPWPACLYDCKAAVRYLRANARKYDIDPRHIGITGASSGGHLALMVGLTDEHDGLEGDVKHVVEKNDVTGHVSSRVQAVVNISGPTEMVTCHLAPIVTPYAESLLGGPPLANPIGYVRSSPIHYVTKDDPPVMTLHGAQDNVVPVQQAKLLAEKMRQVYGDQNVHEMVILAGQSHIFHGQAASRSWEKLYGFFDHWLKPR